MPERELIPYSRQRQSITASADTPFEHFPSTTNPFSVSTRPSFPNTLTIPNPLNLPHQYSTIVRKHITEATSSVSPGTVNVIGHDQINVTNNIHMNPNLNAGKPQDWCYILTL
jgi:hypothetical protein